MQLRPTPAGAERFERPDSRRRTTIADDLLLRRDGAVATLTLNRPERLNALSLDLKQALVSALREVTADDQIRAVVLTGNGRGFCVGQDLQEHAALLAADDPAPLATVSDYLNPIATSLAIMPKPVIAAVNGIAAGAGASMTFACDFRIAAESGAFLLAFANVGLGLDSGASWTLPRLIGTARATALALLAEPVDAQAAFDMGLVNAVVADDRLLDRAHELAARLAEGPTIAFAAIKSALAYGATHSLADSLQFEADLQNRVGLTIDHRNAVEAFLAKQPAQFTGN